ncbi:hypothetical protein ACVWWG_007389 [Bradyrhizobium sp. LB7.2]
MQLGRVINGVDPAGVSKPPKVLLPRVLNRSIAPLNQDGNAPVVSLESHPGIAAPSFHRG